MNKHKSTSSSQKGLDVKLTVSPEWRNLRGQRIEVRRQDVVVDGGRVDVVTNDGCVLWLEADGVSGRRLYLKAEGYEAWCDQDVPGTEWPRRDSPDG